MPVQPREQLLADIAQHLDRLAPHDGAHATALAQVTALKASQPGMEVVHALQQPALCVIAQGCKRIWLRDEAYDYDASRFAVFSLDLPISGQVTEASPNQPYLCLRLDLDLTQVAGRLLASGNASKTVGGSGRGVYVSASTDALLDVLLRLLRLLDEPDDLPALAPLVEQEILHRLLRSDQGQRLAQMARADSMAHRVVQAVHWLKTHYAEPLRIAELAQRVHMSPSALHQHFRAVTALSPLQYQKQLRLLEARRLLSGESLGIARTAYRVGYESPSQFTRDYGRLFGASPSRDQARMRGDAPLTGAVRGPLDLV